MSLNKRILVILVLVIYNLSFVLNIVNFIPYDYSSREVYAEEPKEKEKLIAVFVDASIKSDINDDLNRYAKDYIQTRMKWSKALIIPVNKDNIKAYDIYKILENLYLQWAMNKPSSLEWVILIWDLPLPVVSRDWYYYPTIYPYTDFIDKKFVFNEVSKFFEYHEINDWKPEIWQGMINFKNNITDYWNFFEKLKTYNSNPSDYANKKFWYEDFVHLMKTFNEYNLQYYVNWFLFLEDIRLQRHSELLIDFMFEDYRNFLSDKVSNFENNLKDLKDQANIALDWADSEFDEYKSISDIYFEQAQIFKDEFMTDELISNLDESAWMTPTKVFTDVLNNFLVDYNELYSPEYLWDIREDLKATWRYSEASIDNHMTKIFFKDALAKEILIDYNLFLEWVLDNLVQEKELNVSIPILRTYGLEDMFPTCWVPPFLIWDYENYYFWKFAWNLDTLNDISIYKWDYRNHENVSEVEWLNSSQYSVDDVSIASDLKTMWSSRWLFTTQVYSSRWFNVFDNADSDWDDLQYKRCADDETAEDYAWRFWWWESPLNFKDVTWWASNYFEFKWHDYKEAWDPQGLPWVWWPLYDVWWSISVDSADPYWDTYLWYIENASVIKTRYWKCIPWVWDSWVDTTTVEDSVYCKDKSKDRMPYPDFIPTYKKAKKNPIPWDEYIFKVESINWTSSEDRFWNKVSVTVDDWGSDGWADSSWWWTSTIMTYLKRKTYDYKIYDTVTFHKTPTEEQLSWLNLITPDRPIDDPRYTHFHWFSSNEVKMIYPDLFNVEAFKKENNVLKTLTFEEVKEKLEEYLIKKWQKFSDIYEFEKEKVKDIHDYFWDLYTSGEIWWMSEEQQWAQLSAGWEFWWYVWANYESYDYLFSVDNTVLHTAIYNFMKIYVTAWCSFSSWLLTCWSETFGSKQEFIDYVDILAPVIDENVFMNSLWEDEITRIAENIYYLNLWFDDIPYRDNLMDFMDVAKEHYDVNEKIKYVYSQYFKHSSSTDPLINLDYDENWYEAWLINSKWTDSVYPLEVPEEISEIMSSMNNSSLNYYRWSDLDDFLDSLLSQEEDRECWVDPDWSVILWEWPSAFMCWLNSTLQKPLELTIDYSCSMWKVLFEYWDVWEYLDEELEETWRYDFLWIDWSENTENMPSYLRMDHSEFVNNFWEDNWDDYISNSEIWIWSDEVTNNSIYWNLSDENKEIFDNIRDNIQIKIYPSNVVNIKNVNEEDENYYIWIESTEDIWPISVDIWAVWDNCIEIEWNDVCKTNFSIIPYDPYYDETVFYMDFVKNYSGQTVLQFKICDWDVCYYKNEVLYIVPWDIDQIVVQTPSDTMIKWWTMPISVEWFDEYWNNVTQIIGSYNIWADYWSLIYEWYEDDEIDFNNFWDAYFLLDSKNAWDVSSINVSVDPSWSFSDFYSWMPSGSKEINLVNWVLNVTLDWAEVSEIIHNLPEWIDTYYEIDDNWTSQLKEGSIIKLNLSLTSEDGLPLDSPIEIESRRWTLLPWIVQNTKNFAFFDWESQKVIQKEFVRKENYILEDWNLEIYLHPSFLAWKDDLIIKVPWMEDIELPIEVFPSSPKFVDVKFEKRMYSMDEEIIWTVYVEDIWWNMVYNQNTDIDVWIYWAMESEWEKNKTLTVTEWKIDINFQQKEPWWKVYVSAQISSLSLDEQSADYEELYINNISWPIHNANVMYLNLFWTDWWNMWKFFSDVDWIAPKVLKNSDKTISITTELIDPEKLRNIDILIREDLKLFVNSNLNVSLTFDWNKLMLTYWSFPSYLAKIYIWDNSHFQFNLTDEIPDSIVWNSILYLPEDTDSYIKSNIFNEWMILINEEVVMDFDWGYIHDDLNIVFNKIELKWNYSTFDMIYKNKIIWRLLVHRWDSFVLWLDDVEIIDDETDDLDELDIFDVLLDKDYGKINWFAEWTTNWMMWVYIYNDELIQEDKWKSFRSIEDTNNIDYNWWFRENFKNITNFANWMNVWNSTKHFVSEYLINYWDPLLERISDNPELNWLEYDWWIGKTLYSDPKRKIMKAVDIDFNNDNLTDLIVWYSDWSIRILKNYWWKDPFTDLWDLMVISDWINDLEAWDVDWDWFDDIIIRTWDNRMRVYLNNQWVFDVNWRVMCLDVYWWPEKMDWVYQMFFNDMDNDWAIDIVTNDKNWDVSVFYWWESEDWYNYVSKEIFKCDSSWLDRQDKRLVRSFWISIEEWAPIYDNSLLYWEWLEQDWYSLALTEDVLNPDIDLSDLSDDLEDANPEMPLENTYKYVELSSDYVPAYENTEDFDTIKYAKVSHIDTDTDEDYEIADPFEVYKEYNDLNWWRLEIWDIVRVEVHLKWVNWWWKVTYLDDITWPWLITKNEENVLMTFDEWNLDWWYILRWFNNEDYDFMVDNLTISEWEEYVFSYELEFNWVQPTIIWLEEMNSDGYEDIKIYPNDWCLKWYWQMLSSWERSYSEEFNSIMDEYVAKVQWIQDYMLTEQEDLNEMIETSVNDKTLDEFLWDVFDKDESYWWLVDNGWVDWMDINLTIMDWAFAWLEWKLFNILETLCEWYKFWWDNCGFLPIPFNQAFLSPWIENFMWCPSWIDPWTDVFWFPWTRRINCWDWPFPIQVPNHWTVMWPPVEMSAPTWCWPAVYNSYVRFYVSPTLTQWLWFAACFWDYTMWMTTPANWMWMFYWNCVVTATMLWNECDEWKEYGEWMDNFEIDWWMWDLLDMPTCDYLPVYEWGAVSPFTLVWTDWYSDDYNDILPEWEFFWGLIKFDKQPWVIVQSDSWEQNVTNVFDYISEWLSDSMSESINNEMEIIKWAIPIKLQIEWWNIKWLIDCIIKKWLDRQLRYIMNNLTNMTIYLYIPNFDWLIDWFDRLRELPALLSSEWDNLVSWISSIDYWAWDWSDDSITSIWKSIDEVTQKYLPSRKVFDQASETFSNPFERIKQFFDDVPLINLETKDIVIQVPMVSQEDVQKHIAYLENWYARNYAIYKEWEHYWADLAWMCDWYSDPNEKQDCNNTASQFLSVNIDAEWLLDTVEKNIETLKEYRDYPLKLYEYIHIVDRFLTELSCIIEEFIESTIWWLQDNANRFEKWVDFIITLVWIIETWQIMIDFSVNWRLKCSKCRQDNYDIHSCVLWLLCIDLPILPIPPFKIPDIYLDLSHFDLWVDVILPNFRFVPMSIPLLQLPDLPTPGDFKIDLSLTLPEIPLLPQLPELPEIPSFLPTFSLKLPVLPPAPRLPELVPSIKAIIELSEFIWMLLCLVKDWVWMVAERSVKSRIEQLTQRTWRVEPFDMLNITFVDPPLEWYDVRIDLYTRLRFRFDMFYESAKWIADSINEVTNWISWVVTETTASFNSSSSWIESDIDINETIDEFDDSLDMDIDLDAYHKWDWIDMDEINAYNKYFYGKWEDLYMQFSWNSDYWTGGSIDSYDEIMAKIWEWLEYLSQSKQWTTYWDRAEEVVWILKSDYDVNANIKWVKEVKQIFDWIIRNQSNYYMETASKIKNNYRQFMKEVSWDILVNDRSMETTLSTSLFKSSDELQNLLANQEHPTLSYIKMNEKLIDRYANSLNSSTPESLEISTEEYTKSKEYLNTLKILASDSTDTIIDYSDTTYDDSMYQHAQREWSDDEYNIFEWVHLNNEDIIDAWQFIEWFYLKWEDWKYYSALTWNDFWDETREKNKYELVDINWDYKEDILIRDDNSVYMKYWYQNDEYDTDSLSIYWWLYEFPSLNSIEDIISNTDSDWYYDLWWIKYKIRWNNYSVSKFKRLWQDADSVSFQWENKTNNPVWYVMRLAERVDVTADKYTDSNMPSDYIEDKRYILILWENYEELTDQIVLPWDLDEWFIVEYEESWKIMDVIISDIDWEISSISLTTINEWLDYYSYKREYIDIAPLYKYDNLYKKESPWSFDKVWSNQVWWDQQKPSIELSLKRNKTSEIVSEWNTLFWYINTSYNLEWNWDDNETIFYSWVVDAEWNRTDYDTQKIILEDLFYNNEQDILFEFWATDQVWNTQIQKVRIEIEAPNINIENVNVDVSWWSTIISWLESDLDEWKVKFERNRSWVWESMITEGDISQYGLDVWIEVITWSLYDMKDNINFYNNDGSEIWTINMESWYLEFNSEEAWNYDLDMWIYNWLPYLEIINSSTSQLMFKIYLHPESLVWPNSLLVFSDFNQIDLDWSIFWQFDWWKCISQNNSECMAYISSNWMVYIPPKYQDDIEWAVSYSEDWPHVEYMFHYMDSQMFLVKFRPKKFE